MDQLDLFAPPAAPPPTDADLRWEERYGRFDALCWFGRPNDYRIRLSGDRASAYDRGYEAGITERTQP